MIETKTGPHTGPSPEISGLRPVRRINHHSVCWDQPSTLPAPSCASSKCSGASGGLTSQANGINLWPMVNKCCGQLVTNSFITSNLASDTKMITTSSLLPLVLGPQNRTSVKIVRLWAQEGCPELSGVRWVTRGQLQVSCKAHFALLVVFIRDKLLGRNLGESWKLSSEGIFRKLIGDNGQQVLEHEPDDKQF